MHVLEADPRALLGAGLEELEGNLALALPHGQLPVLAWPQHPVCRLLDVHESGVGNLSAGLGAAIYSSGVGSF